MIKIFIPTPLRKFTDEKSQVEVHADTVSEAIRQLARTFPEIEQHLYDQNKDLRKFVRIFLGNEDIQQLNGPDTKVSEGDEVSIIPAIAGGWMLNVVSATT